MGQGLIGNIFRIVLVTLGIAFAGLGTAGVLVAVTATQRAKAKEAKV